MVLKERNLLKIEQGDEPAKFAYIYSKFLSAYLNYLGANDLRAHGNKPRNAAPAGKEATARFELREVSSADLVASDERLAVKKLEATSEAMKVIAKIALLTQPPMGEKWVVSFGLYGSNPKCVRCAVSNSACIAPLRCCLHGHGCKREFARMRRGACTCPVPTSSSLDSPSLSLSRARAHARHARTHTHTLSRTLRRWQVHSWGARECASRKAVLPRLDCPHVPRRFSARRYSREASKGRMRAD